jgi:magnesium transporter
VLGHLLKPEYEELIAQKDWESLRVAFEDLHPADIAEVLDDLPPEDSGVIFRILPRDVAGTAFEYLPLDQQAELITALGSEQLVNVLNGMSPDDRTRLFEELPAEVTRRALSSLNPDELRVARKLLGYPENSAGRFMTTEYMALRPTMSAREALEYIRTHGKGRETLNVVYVTDDKGALLYDVRLSDLVLAAPETLVQEVPTRHMVALPATAPREEVVSAFEKYDRVALPVVDSKGVLVGIITIDDVLDVAEQEATEDIQKLGGMEALDAPYLEISAWEMFKKRGGWLSILMVSEMLTAPAMCYFEDEIARAVVLALFIPLIMSSGGNSGSQATSLIIRGLAVREIEVKDWWRVLVRELRSGVMLGALLASIGMARIVFWPARDVLYGPHYLMVALTVAVSLIGVVLFGSLAGSMLPFLLRKLGFDPAAASAPFVATLVDVTGLVIYFTVASLVLSGTLLSRGAIAGEALGPAGAELGARAAAGCTGNLLLHVR